MATDVTDSADDVLVIGDALLDVTAAPRDEPRSGGDVPAAIRVAVGGQGANVAVRLARRGLDVRLACAIGTDAAAAIVRDRLAVEGVGVDVDVEATTGEATGTVVILVAPDGERSMLSHRVPLLPLDVEAAAWTVVSGYVLLETGELRLGSRGRLAVLGCALPDEAAAAGWWRRAVDLRPDLIILNADEAAAVGRAPASAAREASAIVVVTRPDGADAALPGEPERGVRTTPVAARDSTGAGDGFAAALIDALRRQPWPPGAAALDAALAEASAFGALVAGVDGAQGRVAGEHGA